MFHHRMMSKNPKTSNSQSEKNNEKRVVEEKGKGEHVYENPTLENGTNNNNEGLASGSPQDGKEAVYDNGEVPPGTEAKGMTKLEIDESKTSYDSPTRKKNAMYGKYDII